jgi:hypothetical protein
MKTIVSGNNLQKPGQVHHVPTLLSQHLFNMAREVSQRDQSACLRLRLLYIGSRDLYNIFTRLSVS